MVSADKAHKFRSPLFSFEGSFLFLATEGGKPIRAEFSGRKLAIGGRTYKGREGTVEAISL